MKETLGSRIRQIREKRRLLQREVAERTGLTVQTIRNVESGRTVDPPASTLRLLEDGLRLRRGELVELRDTLGKVRQQ